MMSPLNASSPTSIGVQGLNQSMNKMAGHAHNMQVAQSKEHNELTNQSALNKGEVNQDQVSIETNSSDAINSANIKQYSSEEQLIYTQNSALEAKANTKVIQAGLDTLGTLIDMKA